MKHSIKNWGRISSAGKANEIIKKSYKFSLIQELSWSYRIKLSLSSMGMLESFVTNDQSSHTKAFQRMIDIFHQNAFAEIREDGSKLRTYGTIKHTPGIEKYLLSNIKQDQRLAMTKLRLSNHELMIEKGRHLKIDKTQRSRPFCPTHIESEKHFMLKCKTYTNSRDTMIRSMADIAPHSTFLMEDEKFIALLSDERFIHISALYIHKAFEIRKFLTNNYKNSE